MTPRRFASLAGTIAVSAIAAVASYDHMRVLAERVGQPGLLASLMPLSVDGMILVATIALGDGRAKRGSAWLAFLVGVAASLAANVMVAQPSAVARVVSAWPAIALLLTVEVLVRSGRAPAPAAIAPPVTATAPAIPAPAVAVPRPTPATPRPRPAVVPVGVRTLAIVPSTPDVATVDGPADATPDAGTPSTPEAVTDSLVITSYPRPAAETRRLHDALKAQNPAITQTAAAQALGMPRRSLRDALAATAEAPAQTATARPRLALGAA